MAAVLAAARRATPALVSLALLAAMLIGVAGRPRDVTRVTPRVGQQAGASHGYWMAAADGGVFGFGDAGFRGSMGGRPINQPIVGMASTPTGRGYWLVARDGGIFSFGDAQFFGSTGGLRLNQPIVGMAASPSGQGYWLVASDGGIFAYGDAGFFGSTGSIRLNRPVVAMAATPSGLGYYLVASDGGIFTFGDSVFRGSTGSLRLNRPVVGMATTPSGHGYWLVASDGGIFSYGDAPFLGSLGGLTLARPVVGMAGTPRGLGYWMVAADGGLFRFGDAGFDGSAAPFNVRAPVVGMTPISVRMQPEVAIFYYPWYATQQHDGVSRHWEAGGYNPPDTIGSNDYPARGIYSSGDPAVLDAQMAEIAGAGIDEIIASWWGVGSYEDSVLPLVAAAASAHGVRVGLHIEPYGGRSVGSVVNDINRAHQQLGINDFWIYESKFAPSDAWAAAMAQVGGVRVFAQTGDLTSVVNGSFAAYARDAQFDGVYTYDPVRYGRTQFANACGSARQNRIECAPSVAPGYVAWRAKPSDQRVVSRDAGSRYDNQWADATQIGADIITITSYNEWHEGTEIEPATHHCGSDSYCTSGFDFSYGLTGPAAETAYVNRTRVLSDTFRFLRS